MIQSSLYSHWMLTIATRLGVTNRSGRSRPLHKIVELMVILNGARAARRPKALGALGVRTAAGSPTRADGSQ